MVNVFFIIPILLQLISAFMTNKFIFYHYRFFSKSLNNVNILNTDSFDLNIPNTETSIIAGHNNIKEVKIKPYNNTIYYIDENEEGVLDYLHGEDMGDFLTYLRRKINSQKI